MTDEIAKELECLATEYDSSGSEPPFVMNASCYGGGGGTTSKSPGCADMADDQDRQ